MTKYSASEIKDLQGLLFLFVVIYVTEVGRKKETEIHELCLTQFTNNVAILIKNDQSSPFKPLVTSGRIVIEIYQPILFQRIIKEIL